jgi:hypothetical protein
MRLLIAFIFLTKLSFAQDTLRMQYTHGYSKYFVLNENNDFELFFNHCTGRTYGKGKVKKGLFKWVFTFETHPCQESRVVIDSIIPSDSIKINLFEFPDSTIYEPMFFLVNRNKLTYFQGFRYPKSKITSDSLLIYLDDNYQFKLKNVSLLSSVDIYLFTGWLTYFDCEKMVLHKRNKAFFERDVNYEEKKEEPWKKTKKRFKNWYKFSVLTKK